MQSEIQQARHRLGWTVADLAARIAVSPRTVEGWEQGKRPSGPARKALERTLKIKLP